MTYRKKRFRLFADWKLQGMFCMRICAYWLICQAAMVVTILGFLTLAGQSEVGVAVDDSPWRFISPAIVASFLFLPLLLLDNLRFTNRFAGPIYRFRKDFQKLADGEDVSRLDFRKGDYFSDLSKNFNAIQSRLKQAEELNRELQRVDRVDPLKYQLTSTGWTE